VCVCVCVCVVVGDVICPVNKTKFITTTLSYNKMFGNNGNRSTFDPEGS
jgi:hypothetical protein